MAFIKCQYTNDYLLTVNWRMQIKVNQVKHRVQEEYGTNLDEFLDHIYQAGMDINQDLDDMIWIIFIRPAWISIRI